METSIGFGAIPNLKNYTMYADSDMGVCNHGGIVCYVKTELVTHMFNLQFNESYISFRLDFMPSLLIIASYIQPENSRYFDPSMFSNLCSLLLTAKEKKLILVLGGDINCRFGDLNILFKDENLVYDKNTDLSSNRGDKW